MEASLPRLEEPGSLQARNGSERTCRARQQRLSSRRCGATQVSAPQVFCQRQQQQAEGNTFYTLPGVLAECHNPLLDPVGADDEQADRCSLHRFPLRREDSPLPERTFYLALSLRLLDLGPDILERDRTIEDQHPRRRIRINTEISLPLELIAVAERRAGEAGFETT